MSIWNKLCVLESRKRLFALVSPCERLSDGFFLVSKISVSLFGMVYEVNNNLYVNEWVNTPIYKSKTIAIIMFRKQKCA